MEATKRVLVHLRKEPSLLQCAQFLQGITGHFAPGGQDRVTVNFGLDQNRFILSDVPFSGSRSAELQRPEFCPIKNLGSEEAAALPEEVRRRGVDVGVAILLQSVNRRVLLTRRAKELHIFPNVWVPPGGHMEEGEELLDAGLRELQEETGLNLGGAALPWSILGLWESAFPPLLSRGPPRRHHIIAYLLVLSNQTHQELQEKLRPDAREVSACVWLPPDITQKIVTTRDGVKDSGRKSPEPQTSIMITEVGDRLVPVDLPLQKLLDSVPVDGEDAERVSTGTRYALRLWLETLR